MRIEKIFKALLCYVLTCLLWTQGFAFEIFRLQKSTLHNGGKLLPNQLSKYVQKHNSRFRTVDDSVRFLRKHFTKNSDIKYLEKVIKEVALTTALPKLVAKGDHALIKTPDGTKIKISDVNIYGRTMKLNGVQYKFNPSDGLEAMHKRILGIWEKTTKREASMLDLVISPSYAVLLVGITIFTLFVVLPITLSWLYLDNIEKDLDEMVSLCENRDDRVPYTKSEIFGRYQEFLVSDVVDMDSLKQYRDCVGWAKYWVSKSTGVAPTYLVRVCNKTKRLKKCMEVYENNVRTSDAARGTGKDVRTNVSRQNPYPARKE